MIEPLVRIHERSWGSHEYVFSPTPFYAGAKMDAYFKLLETYSLTEEIADGGVSNPEVGHIISFDAWESLCPHLKMPYKIVKWARSQNWTMEGREEFYFNEWKKRQGSGATYKELITALLDIQRKETAEHVCKWLKASRNKRDTTASQKQERISIAPGDIPGWYRLAINTMFKGCLSNLL